MLPESLLGSTHTVDSGFIRSYNNGMVKNKVKGADMKVNQDLTDKIAYLLGKCNAAELERVARELTIYPRKAQMFSETVTEELELSRQRVKAYCQQ